MNRTPKKIAETEHSSENINGILTSESFNVYSKLQNPKKSFSFRIFLLYFLIVSLLGASAIVFASTIKTAYFNNETEECDSNINTIRTSYQKNENLKVETITPELSELFGIPVGVKIVGIDYENPIFNGLKHNDIIVGISGKPIENIAQMDNAIAQMSDDIFLTYDIYRNGAYKTIDPYEIDE